MGVGKTERLGINTSRFDKGRRVDEANERIIRNLKVKGGRIRKSGDSWTIEVFGLPATGLDTISAAPATIPDIELSTTSAGAATGTVVVLTGLAVDGSNKHKLNLTTNSITIPEGSGTGLPAGTGPNRLLRWNATSAQWEQIGPYTEIDVVLYTGDRKITGTMLFKASAADVPYSSAVERQILQVKAVTGGGGTTYQLSIDFGYLAVDG